MIAARLIAVFLAAAAIPATANEVPKGIPVTYGDLDLGTAAGQSELKLRLHDAAAKLCSPSLAELGGSDQSAREHNELYQACIGRLSQRAMANIGRN